MQMEARPPFLVPEGKAPSAQCLARQSSEAWPRPQRPAQRSSCTCPSGPLLLEGQKL